MEFEIQLVAVAADQRFFTMTGDLTVFGAVVCHKSHDPIIKIKPKDRNVLPNEIYVNSCVEECYRAIRVATVFFIF